MANKNKVEFGLSNVHIGTYEANLTGPPVLGVPEHIPGAVNLTLEEESELYNFFADDVIFYSEYSDSGESGELTMALFPDSFKLKFLPYIQLADGGVAKLKGQTSKNAYLIFEGKGDVEKRRHIIYNISFGAIKRERKTIEGTKEVETEVMPITVVGDNSSGIVKVSYSESDPGYAGLFTAAPVPKLPVTTPGV